MFVEVLLYKEGNLCVDIDKVAD